jgi:predicted kinase
MKNRITILVGISGSGKSTLAHEEWLKDPQNVMIVNRDKIREQFFGYTEDTMNKYYERDDIYSLEKQVTRFEDTLIHDALNLGKDVIVDATHLKRAYIERFKFWNVSTTYKMIPIMVKEAEIRDRGRKRRVGGDIIKRQNEQYVNLFHDLLKNPIDFTPVTLLNNSDGRDVVIFDIDGTLAHKGERSAYDWKAVGQDIVDEPTAEIMDMIKCSGSKVIICTGRDGIARYETEKWLKLNKLNYDALLIRAQGDSRPDWIVKEEMWRDIAKDYHIVGMFDDRLQVTRRARSLGLKVFNVEYGNF